MKFVLALTLGFVATASGAEAQSKITTFNPLATIKLEDLSQTRDRPLFSPSRRPPPPVVEAPPPPAPVVAEVKPPANEPPPFDLVGVVVGGDSRFVLLASHGGGAVSRLRPGDEQDGWRVGEISIRSVVLERDGREESLALAGPSANAGPDTAKAPEVAERRTDDGGISPGPIRDEYKRLMKQLAVKR